MKIAEMKEKYISTCDKTRVTSCSRERERDDENVSPENELNLERKVDTKRQVDKGGTGFLCGKCIIQLGFITLL